MPAFSAFSSWVKKLLLGLLALALVLPAVQAKWHLLAVAPLGGYAPPAEHPRFSWQSLRAGEYQDQLDHYLSDRLGFRELAIRARNQVAYSAFHEIHAIDVLLGQREVLYQGGPAEAYVSHDYLGDAAIAEHAQRVRNVQDSLAQHGVQLLYVLAPGKPGYQPEDLPPGVQAMYTGITNYSTFARVLPAAGVHVLDASVLFKQWKLHTPHPLFPRGGTHWSGYGVTRVADTLFKAVAALTHAHLPAFAARPGLVTTDPDSLRYTDADIALGLNLLRMPTPYPMAYPRLTFTPPTAAQTQLNALVIGDSFTQSFYGFYPYFQHLLSARSRFWYYNELVYWPTPAPGEKYVVHELDLREQLAGRQLVIILATEQNMVKKSFGFIDQVYELYHPDTPGK